MNYQVKLKLASLASFGAWMAVIVSNTGGIGTFPAIAAGCLFAIAVRLDTQSGYEDASEMIGKSKKIVEGIKNVVDTVNAHNDSVLAKKIGELEGKLANGNLSKQDEIAIEYGLAKLRQIKKELIRLE